MQRGPGVTQYIHCPRRLQRAHSPQWRTVVLPRGPLLSHLCQSHTYNGGERVPFKVATETDR